MRYQLLAASGGVACRSFFIYTYRLFFDKIKAESLIFRIMRLFLIRIIPAFGPPRSKKLKKIANWEGGG